MIYDDLMGFIEDFDEIACIVDVYRVRRKSE